MDIALDTVFFTVSRGDFDKFMLILYIPPLTFSPSSTIIGVAFIMSTNTPMNEAQVSIRDFRDKLGENLDRIKRGEVLVLVSHKRPSIVLMDYQEYRRLKQAAGESEQP